jgi:hypothetical protein
MISNVLRVFAQNTLNDYTNREIDLSEKELIDTVIMLLPESNNLQIMKKVAELKEARAQVMSKFLSQNF